MSEQLDQVIKVIADGIVEDTERLDRQEGPVVNRQPRKDDVIELLQRLQSVLFPAHFIGKDVSSAVLGQELISQLERIERLLTEQISLVLPKSRECGGEELMECREKARGMAEQLLRSLPEIRRLLMTDLNAAYDGDPAAVNHDEIILSYPGFFAITVYRLALRLCELGVPILPRMMTEHAHSLTGIDIHPGAQIGEYFFIDHGTGVVIGETTVIGDRVKIYQGVTLGGLSTREGQGLRGVKRHPTIEDDVTIYSGASILGGGTVVGRQSVIGGNAFITASVPPHSRVSMRTQELNMTTEEQKLVDKSEYWSGDWII